MIDSSNYVAHLNGVVLQIVLSQHGLPITSRRLRSVMMRSRTRSRNEGPPERHLLPEAAPDGSRPESALN